MSFLDFPTMQTNPSCFFFDGTNDIHNARGIFAQKWMDRFVCYSTAHIQCCNADRTRLNSTDYWTIAPFYHEINYRFSHFSTMILFSCFARRNTSDQNKPNERTLKTICLCLEIVNDSPISNYMKIHKWCAHSHCARIYSFTLYIRLFCFIRIEKL